MSLPPDTEHDERRRWMAVLARAEPAELERAWDALAARPDHVWVRPPETGMTMVRGRAGGTGQPFNLGEMTLTRCALRIDGVVLGVAYVKGRGHRHAELAALFDAMLQREGDHDSLMQTVIGPLERRQAESADAARRKTAATKVDFFTMATGREQP